MFKFSRLRKTTPATKEGYLSCTSFITIDQKNENGF